MWIFFFYYIPSSNDCQEDLSFDNFEKLSMLLGFSRDMLEGCTRGCWVKCPLHWNCNLVKTEPTIVIKGITYYSYGQQCRSSDIRTCTNCGPVKWRLKNVTYTEDNFDSLITVLPTLTVLSQVETRCSCAGPPIGGNHLCQSNQRRDTIKCTYKIIEVLNVKLSKNLSTPEHFFMLYEPHVGEWRNLHVISNYHIK